MVSPQDVALDNAGSIPVQHPQSEIGKCGMCADEGVEVAHLADDELGLDLPICKMYYLGVPDRLLPTMTKKEYDAYLQSSEDAWKTITSRPSL